MGFSPKRRVAFVLRRVVALALLGLGVHRSFAFSPTVISHARSVGGSVPDETNVSDHGSCASAMVSSSYTSRTKTELASLFGPRHRYRRSWEDSEESRYDMSLSMGLGFDKIIGNVRRREGPNSGRRRSESDDDEEEEEDLDSITRNSPMTVPQAREQTDKGSAPQASHSPRSSDMEAAEPMDSESTRTKVVRMGEDPATREVDVHALDKTESVQERINRVKAGKMTPEEKAAFLDSVLTAGSTVEARKPVIRSKEAEKPVSASPFPSDSAFRNIARGNKTTVPSSSEDNLEYSQQKKREYLNMVTNPNRFGPYKTYSQNFGPEDRPSSAPVPQKVDASSRTATPVQKKDYSSSSGNRPPSRPFEPQRPLSSVKSSSQDPVQPPMPNDLGARLGMAAMASENQRQKELLKAEEARREQERQREKERQKFEIQAMEIARQKEEEISMREVEVQEKRRKQEEEAARRKEQEKSEAEERMAALIKAQEEYWQKKLAAERASKAKLWGDQQKAEKEPTENEPKTKESPVEQGVKKAVAEKPEEKVLVPTEVEFVAPVPTVAPVPPPSSSAFNPNEQYLVEEGEHDREDDWHHNQETISREASKYSGGKSSNDIQTESQFIADQAKKKSFIDHQKDEQLEKLRALNSPLPSPVKPSRAMPPAPPFQERRSVLGYPSNFQPQKPLGTTLDPQKPTEAVPKKNSDQLNSLFNSLNGDDADGGVSEEQPKPALDAVDRKETISDLQNKQKEDSYSKIQFKEKGVKHARGNLFGGAVKKQSPRDAPKPLPSSEESDPPTRKDPIRMEIPTEGDDEERSTDIKEAIRKAKAASSSVDQNSRSKKWGIDMSRFTDD